MTNSNNRQTAVEGQTGETKMKQTIKFLLSAALVVPVMTGLIPYTANAQIDPGSKKPEASPAAPPAMVVTGTVALSSMPPITGTVGISGLVPVTVGNTPAAPVYTVDSDAAQRRPYALFAQQAFDSANNLYDSFPSSAAALSNETSKLFVITNFSSSVYMHSSDVLMNCTVSIGSTGATGGIPALAQQQIVLPTGFSGVVQSGPSLATDPVVYSANTAVLMYLMPAQKASVFCTRGAAAGQTLADGTTEYVSVNLTGHLQEVPAASAQ